MSDSIPVILCGKSPQIAQGVKQALLPEYEVVIHPAIALVYLLTLIVVHVILTPAAGVAEIPIVLEGNTPPPVRRKILVRKLTRGYQRQW